MADLFAPPPPAGTPLAERLRPRTIDEVVGQRHLLGPGKPLAVAFHAGKLHSMILWGPPGVGKTTLARLMADAFNAEFVAISAVLAGVKDIRDAVARAELTRAQSGRATIMFVDEVHRFNKAQQDAFLPWVEQGAADVHRRDDREPVLRGELARCCRAPPSTCSSRWPRTTSPSCSSARRRAAMPDVTVDAAARDALIAYADGDGRRLINLVEQLAIAAAEARRASVDMAFVEQTIARSLRRFDKGGEAFYDQISALHKAVRGSDPDASLYWLVRMLDGGADPLYCGRRLIRMASEDIGLADPRALEIALAAVAGLRAARLARGRARARAVRALPRGRAEVERRVHGVRRRARVRQARTARARCRCACATRRRGS